jgi:hypothetical protein
MSSGHECLIPFTRIDLTTAFAGSPVTETVEGYGLPGPDGCKAGATPGIVTDPPLEYVLV